MLTSRGRPERHFGAGHETITFVPLRPTPVLLSACLFVIALSGCGGDGGPNAIGASVEDERSLLLRTTCAANVAAEVEEGKDRVEITEVRGDTVDGECVGGVRLLLDAPLGARSLWVEGERWVPLEGQCPYGDFGPADRTQPAGCTRGR